jgi:chromosome segregation ATPase
MTQDPHDQSIHLSKKRRSYSLLLSYAKRHRRFLTLLGTFILFFTFILRDVLREDARAKKDNYDAAETSFSILDGLIGINDRIRHLEVVIEGHLRALKEAASKESHFEDTPTLRGAAAFRVEDLQNAIRNLKRVCGALPSSAISLQNKNLMEVEESTEILATKFTNLRCTSSGLNNAPETLWHEYNDLVDEARSLQQRVKEIAKSVLNVLESESSEAAWKFKAFDNLSLAFYILGVLVTGISQLAASKDDPSSD